MVGQALRQTVLINGIVQIVEGHLFVDPSTPVGYAGVHTRSTFSTATETPGNDSGLNVSGRVVLQRTYERTSAVTLWAKLNDHSLERKARNSRRAAI